VIPAQDGRRDALVVVDEVEERKLDADERLDAFEQLAGDRRRVVGAAERGRDRGE
jgi:hypothetical protein